MRTCGENFRLRFEKDGKPIEISISREDIQTLAEEIKIILTIMDERRAVL